MKYSQIRDATDSATGKLLRRQVASLAATPEQNTNGGSTEPRSPLQDLRELGAGAARASQVAAGAHHRQVELAAKAETMKALSVRQPWAWLIVNGHKDIENRSWQTKFRGKLLIHAGQRFDPKGVEAA